MSFSLNTRPVNSTPINGYGDVTYIAYADGTLAEFEQSIKLTNPAHQAAYFEQIIGWTHSGKMLNIYQSIELNALGSGALAEFAQTVASPASGGVTILEFEQRVL